MCTRESFKRKVALISIESLIQAKHATTDNQATPTEPEAHGAKQNSDAMHTGGRDTTRNERTREQPQERKKERTLGEGMAGGSIEHTSVGPEASDRECAHTTTCGRTLKGPQL